MLIPYELYQSLKYAISNQSIQILTIIYSVFQDQINDVLTQGTNFSFWEKSKFDVSDKALAKV